MDNNAILRRLRYTFDLNDDSMMSIFAEGGLPASREQISNWMKPEEDENFVSLYDKHLAIFLNGFITEKRGKKDGPPAKAEKTLTNNIILRKLKIALSLQEEGMMEIFDHAGMRIGKHELRAFFRKPEQRQYRLCRDQFLRNFLMGLQLKYRGRSDE